MKNKDRPKLTLDRPASYQIKIPGHLDESWSDWAEGLTIVVESEGDGVDRPVTILTGTVDQAALHGLLRRLYSLGLPLISVICVELDPESRETSSNDGARGGGGGDEQAAGLWHVGADLLRGV